MACEIPGRLADCSLCNYTHPPWCCSDHCEQEIITVPGYCMPKDISQKCSFDPIQKILPTSSWATGLVIAVFLTLGLILFGFLIWIYKRRTTTASGNIVLTAAEIKEFLEGTKPSKQRLLTESTSLIPNSASSEPTLEQQGIRYESEKVMENFKSQPYDRKLDVPITGFKLEDEVVLGSGAYGLVIKGTLWGQDAAVKTIKPNSDKVYLKSLLSEVKVLTHLGHHNNIVTLLGVFTSNLKYGTVYLFLEYCKLGSLHSYLQKCDREEKDRAAVGVESGSSDAYYENILPANFSRRMIAEPDVLNWSLQLANAMRFLEDRNVIHGDIATRNILLYEADHIKLTDFGLSRRLYEYGNYVKQKQEPLPWRWMAIEALKKFNFSIKSDVWSFAVTMWEMYSFGDVPFSGMNWTQEFTYLLFDGLRLLQPKGCGDQVFNLMMGCWKNEPTDRPTFSDIHKNLLKMKVKGELTLQIQ